MKERSVMIFGTFDGLHPGHESLFEQARKFGGKLIVVVARDETVKRVKGRIPKHDEGERLAGVKKHHLVDAAVLGNIHDKYKVIEEFQPDIICLGYDQKAFTENLGEELNKRGMKVKVIRLKAFMPEKYKSSILNGKK